MGRDHEFGVWDVLGDAMRSWGRRFAIHLGFDALFLAVLFVATCCLSVSVIAGGAVVAGAADGGSGGATEAGVAMVALGLAALLGFASLAAMAFHHGASVQVALEDLRGATPTFRGSLEAAGARFPSHLGMTALRFVLDVSLVAAIIGVAVSVEMGSRALGVPNGLHLFESPLGILIVLVVVYVPIGAGLLGIRAFLGLANVVIQAEALGVADAARRSHELLAGHRLRFIAVRVVWLLVAVAAIALSYAPVIGSTFLADDGATSAVVLLFLVPYAFATYAFWLMLYSLDSAVEVAFYARIAPTSSPSVDLVETFR